MSNSENTLTPQTPFELLRRSHKSAQRQVEKDFIAVQVSNPSINMAENLIQSVLNGLLRSFGEQATEDAKQTTLSKLDLAADRVKGLKRKVSSSKDLELTTVGRPSTE